MCVNIIIYYAKVHIISEYTRVGMKKLLFISLLFLQFVVPLQCEAPSDFPKRKGVNRWKGWLYISG